MQRYRQDELVGAGGAGAVYKGFDLQLQRTVAIKRLRDPAGSVVVDAGRQGTPEALIQEAKTLSSLQHPNIVTVYDVALDEDGHPFVVMEFLSGQDLAQVVKRGTLTEPDFLVVAEQVLQALIVAHGRGILHRDIKPRNLMLEWLTDESFQVKLLDFGLAKLTHSPVEQSVDQGGAMLGSINYMTPEQFERKPIDARTDLYSLGATLYFALTGTQAYEGETGPEVMAAHLHHLVPSLSPLRPDLPTALCDWVERLMSRRPEDRPASAREALQLLHALRHPTGATAVPPQSPRALCVPVNVQYGASTNFSEEPERPNQGAGRIVTVILLVLLVLGGGVYLATRSPSPGSASVIAAEPAAAISPAQVAALDPLAIDSLEAWRGKVIQVKGLVRSCGESKSKKTRYLNFGQRSGDSLSIAFLVSQVGDAFPKGRLDGMVGKTIAVEGQLALVNQKDWLIFVEDERQISVENSP